jgi:hypothetical protein
MARADHTFASLDLPGMMRREHLRLTAECANPVPFMRRGPRDPHGEGLCGGNNRRAGHTVTLWKFLERT